MQSLNSLRRELKVVASWSHLGFLAIAISAVALFNSGTIVARDSVHEAIADPAAQQWVKPQARWIYVLDSNKGLDTAQILLLDPTQNSVVETIQVGHAPDMTLAPDGKRLYVASGPPGVISVVDTETGNVIRQFPAGDRLVQIGLPAIPVMAVSPNGRWLSLMETTGETPATTTYGVAVFDTLNNYVLAGHVVIDGCGIGRLVWVSDSKSFVQCPLSNSISVLTLNGAGQPSAAPLVQLPEAIRPAVGPLPIHVGRVAHVMFLPDGENAAIFTPFGEVSELNLLSQRSSPKVGARADSWVSLRDWPHSTDGKKVYIGIGTGLIASRSSGETSEINVFDTDSWQYTGAYKTSVPFWSLALSKDDRYLYAVSRSTRKVIVFDTLTNTEIGAIENVGITPALAIAAP